MTEVGENTGFCIDDGETRHWVSVSIYRLYMTALKRAQDAELELKNTRLEDWPE